MKWQNSKRPARRFLYFRHAMVKFWGIKNPERVISGSLPPGHIWATPDKTTGYLRKSTLRGLAKRVGDIEIDPFDPSFVNAGTFDDTEQKSKNEAAEASAPLTLAGKIEVKLEEDVDDDNYDDEEDSEYE